MKRRKVSMLEIQALVTGAVLEQLENVGVRATSKNLRIVTTVAAVVAREVKTR